jgi:hypothetical protein
MALWRLAPLLVARDDLGFARQAMELAWRLLHEDELIRSAWGPIGDFVLGGYLRQFAGFVPHRLELFQDHGAPGYLLMAF